MSSPSVLDKSSVIQLDERPSSEEYPPTSSSRNIKLMVCYESSTESQDQTFISGMFVSSLMITWMKDVPCLFLTVSKFLCTFTIHHLLSALYYLHVSNSQIGLSESVTFIYFVSDQSYRNYYIMQQKLIHRFIFFITKSSICFLPKHRTKLCNKTYFRLYVWLHLQLSFYPLYLSKAGELKSQLKIQKRNWKEPSLWKILSGLILILYIYNLSNIS